MRIAYFITFRCYGTWLHGDERGSVDQGHNASGDEFLRKNLSLERFRRENMKSTAQKLNGERRSCAEAAIEEVMTHRGWINHALNIRTNHVHCVVGAEETPEKVMNDFKAYATRRLRRQKLLPQNVEIWAEHGSTIYLWDAFSFEAACDYVLNQQGEPLESTEPEA